MKFFRQIRNIIWDWNGTLVDDVDLCVTVINDIRARRSLPAMNLNDYKEAFNFPVRDYYQRIGFDFAKDSFEQLSREFIEGYENGRQSLSLHSDAIAALEYFRQRKIPQCLLSATQLQSLEYALKDHKIAHYFNSVLGLDHHYADNKTHLGRQWLQRNNISKNQVLFIGDTLHDLEVAQAMGINCVLIASGHHNYERLRSSNSIVLYNLKGVIDIFEK